MSTGVVLRSPMSVVTRGWRAYFAPVDRVRNVPAIFDPARDGRFNPDAPSAPWIDAGCIGNFSRKQNTKLAAVRSGPKGAPAAQCRTELDARVEFDFCQWGKLQMALASATEHINVLAETANTSGAPSGGTAAAAVAVQSGSTANEVIVGTSGVASFSVGDLIAIDVDYTGQTGYVGAGVSTGYVKSATGLGLDYIRRITFNVSRVAQKTATSLMLSQPLIGGAPGASARVQKVIAFADREGGNFTPEWSALFVLDAEAGGRVCLYYPRLQPCAPASEPSSEFADSLRVVGLHASFVALPYTDPIDGEPTLCWRSYIPAGNAAV